MTQLLPVSNDISIEQVNLLDVKSTSSFPGSTETDR